MRLHLKLSPNTEPVNFNYQHQLTGVLHKWLGENDLHDKISLYSFSWLRGKVKSSRDGLYFPNGARWFISFWEKAYGADLIQGIVDQSEVAYGMEVDEVQIVRSPEFKNKWRFKVSSPVLVRSNRDEGGREHLTFRDNEADKYLKRTLIRKLKEADVTHDDFKISFDDGYSGARTKLIDVKGTKLKSNLCPIIMEGDPTAIEFAWNVGIGELTGSGFGALC
ncbi:MAG TPA: CRISPR-associated endoribonuclease Cas6 [Balneolaceae bacterium]|nr:CRISPR-associated endoribonuclease Cas6 [Balneolaceae bacterium]